MPSKSERRDQILDVAVQLLSEKGYRDTSMLEIAKRSSASKETLYSWFGDKKGLFSELIKRNAAKAQKELHVGRDKSPEATLQEFGESLLTMLLSDSAIAINRAAISEAQADPTLPKALIEHGRSATLPVFKEFLSTCHERNELEIKDPSQAAEDFLGLLIGDLQIRRLLGTESQPNGLTIKTRAEAAVQKFMKLYQH